MYRSNAMAPKTHAWYRGRNNGQCSIRPIFVGKPIPKLDRFLSRNRCSKAPVAIDPNETLRRRRSAYLNRPPQNSSDVLIFNLVGVFVLTWERTICCNGGSKCRQSSL